MKNVKEKETN